MKLYSIYDRVSGVYGAPFVQIKEDQAIRQFNYLMNNSPMVRDDCELYYLGSFEEDSGLIFPETKPVFVVKYVSGSSEG